MPVKEIRDSVRDDCTIRSGCEVLWHAVVVPDQGVVEVGRHGTHVDGSVRTAHALKRVTSGFESFVHGFQQDALLRVHRVGLVGADVEEGGIEGTHIFLQQIRPSYIGGTVVGTDRVVEGRRIEPYRRDVNTHIAWGLDKLP